MIDQLHVFPDEAAADLAFPRPLGEDGSAADAPCWSIGMATIIPVEIAAFDGAAVVASDGVWRGVSTSDQETADALWLSSACAVELERPSEPTPCGECVTRSRLTQGTLEAVVSVNPLFSGSGYQFFTPPDIDQS